MMTKIKLWCLLLLVFAPCHGLGVPDRPRLEPNATCTRDGATAAVGRRVAGAAPTCVCDPGYVGPPVGGACWRRAKKGILFGHTFFAQTDAKAVLCAMPSGDEPECSCCATLKALEPAATSNGGAYGHKMETTGGSSMRWMGMRAAKLQQGCADYQMFWD